MRRSGNGGTSTSASARSPILRGSKTFITYCHQLIDGTIQLLELCFYLRLQVYILLFSLSESSPDEFK